MRLVDLMTDRHYLGLKTRRTKRTGPIVHSTGQMYVALGAGQGADQSFDRHRPLCCRREEGRHLSAERNPRVDCPTAVDLAISEWLSKERCLFASTSRMH